MKNGLRKRFRVSIGYQGDDFIEHFLDTTIMYDINHELVSRMGHRWRAPLSQFTCYIIDKHSCHIETVQYRRQYRKQTY